MVSGIGQGRRERAPIQWVPMPCHSIGTEAPAVADILALADMLAVADILAVADMLAVLVADMSRH